MHFPMSISPIKLRKRQLPDETGMINQAFAIWLVPEKKQARYLSGVISYLSQEHKGPCFEPHCTIASGVTATIMPIIDSVAKICLNTYPVTLTIDRIDSDEQFFMTLFLALRSAPTLVSLRAGCLAAFRENNTKPFFPHVSLLYAKMPLSQKKALAESLDIPLASIVFDTIKIISPENRTRGWFDITSWKTLFEMKLP
jgi:2'-5' RNA ligase